MLWPRSADRALILSEGSSARIGAIAFFGVTTSIASGCYTALARYAIDDIDLKPRFWQAPFELEILGVNLKNACVEFLNALILAGFALVILRLFRRKTSYRECMSAFLYAYAIAILVWTVWLLATNAFLTSDTQTGPTVWQWANGGGGTYDLTMGSTSQTFRDDKLLLRLPFFLTQILQEGRVYFLPLTYSIFNPGGIAVNWFSAWDEVLVIIMLVDWKVLLAAYILRLRPLVGIAMVVICSILGFYVDAVLSRYTAKHTLLAYVSTRMHPTVELTQAFRYSTTYFDNFPMKTGDLALVDFWQCKWSRHPENQNSTSGRDYRVGNALHFDFTYTVCDQAKPSVASFLMLEYEIVRVVATANQKVAIADNGEIKVDGAPIADRASEENVEFRYRVLKQVADRNPQLRTEPTGDPNWVEYPVPGKQLIYTYRNASLPHEPQGAGYVWDCRACDSETLTEDDSVVPDGYFLAMFDFMARPRMMLIRTKDLLGYPFVTAKKRW